LNSIRNPSLAIGGHFGKTVILWLSQMQIIFILADRSGLRGAKYYTFDAGITGQEGIGHIVVPPTPWPV